MPGGLGEGLMRPEAGETAYLIEDGRLGPPVFGATLIGHGPDVLTKVTRIGHDLRLDEGVGLCQKAEVLDADALAAFQENGLFDRATATSFRKNILERGGTAEAMELWKVFRGREPDVEPLLKRRGLK